MARRGAPRPGATAPRGRDASRRRDRRRRLHRALDGARAQAASAGARTSSSSRRSVRHRAERTERRLPPRLLVEPRRGCRSSSARDGALAVARASDGAIAAVRALGEDVWLREGGLLRVSTAAGAGRDPRRARSAAARELGVPERGDPARRAEELAARCSSPRLPARRLLPRRRDGPAGAARPRAAARGAGVGVRLYERTPASRDPRRRRHARAACRAGGRRRDERLERPAGGRSRAC